MMKCNTFLDEKIHADACFKRKQPDNPLVGYSKDCFLGFTDHLEVSTFETSSAALFGSPVPPHPAAPFCSR